MEQRTTAEINEMLQGESSSDSFSFESRLFLRSLFRSPLLSLRPSELGTKEYARLRKDLQEGVKPICECLSENESKRKTSLVARSSPSFRLNALPSFLGRIRGIDNSLQTLHSQANKHAKTLA